MPNALAQFVNFTSLIFVSFTDFIVPWALYIVLQRQKHGTNECETSTRAVFLAREVERPPGVHVHNALPTWSWLSSTIKIRLAGSLATILALAAMIATVLTVAQGTYEFSAQ